jgi:ubiquinone biosynthesis protein
MRNDPIARLYADAAEDLSRGWLDVGATLLDANRRLLSAARAWGDEARAAEEVFLRAVRRSGEEAQDFLDLSGGSSGVALLTRFADLARARAFLWAAAGLSAGERFGWAASANGAALPWVPPWSLDLAVSASSLRLYVLGVVATELWLGYAGLRERGRWLPGTVGDEDWELQHRRGAGRVLDTAKALGGTLIKAAQFASSRPDILPAPYVESLSELQDRVPPQPWTVIEEAVSREVGGPLEGVFGEFETEPVAAASIAQVHRARLKDGRRVAAKVQYPRISSLIEADLAVLEEIFGAINRLEPSVDLRPILFYLRWTLPMELDFVREARAIADLKSAIGHRYDVIIPGVVEGLSTERLLVLELVEGVKITDREGLERAGIDPARVAELLIDAYAEQLFEHGVLHADPHPGNLFVQCGPSDPRLVLLDHGLTLAVPPELLAALKDAIGALQEGDFEALMEALRRAGLDLDPDMGFDALLGVVGALLGGSRSDRGEEANEGEADLGQFALSLGASIGHIPNELLLVGRAIGLIEGIIRQIAPDLDTVGIVARYAQNTR